MYLIRLDDAAQNWNWENWYKIEKILDKHNVCPIFGIIPNNEDAMLLELPEDSDFFNKVNMWIKKGWTPALHGYCHKYITNFGGINPVNNRSEFAGVPLELQKEKIRDGYKILKDLGIDTNIFFAPSHTFDNNTLIALKEETDIRIISDTIANDIYFKNDFYFIPQQSGKVRILKNKITTFCYHPNFITEQELQELDQFLQLHSSEFVSFNDLEFTKRKLNVYDKLLSKIYFLRRKIIRILKNKFL